MKPPQKSKIPLSRSKNYVRVKFEFLEMFNATIAKLNNFGHNPNPQKSRQKCETTKKMFKIITEPIEIITDLNSQKTM